MEVDYKDIKLVSESNQEYCVVSFIQKDDGDYGLITNLIDITDSKFVKFDSEGENIRFTEIDDTDIIAEIIAAANSVE